MKLVKYFFGLSLAAAFFILPARAIGADNSAAVLSLDSIIGQAIENNPQLESDRQIITRDREMITIERSLENPTFEIMFDDQPVSSRSLGSGMRKNYKFTQMFHGPGKRSLMGKAAASMSEASAAGYEISRLNIIRDIKENYYMLFMARNEKKIVEKSIAILTAFMSIVMQRYQLGLANQTDILKLNIEIEKMKTGLIQIAKNDRIATAKLNGFMNKKDGGSFEIELAMKTGEINLSAAELYEMAVKSNPDILSASKMVEKNEYGVALSRAARRPDFMLGAQYSNLRGDMEENRWSLMVGATLPIYKKRINAGIKAAQAELRSTVEMKKAMENDTYRMIEEELAYLAAQNELINKYGVAIIPAANLSIQAAMIAYQNSQIDYESLVMTQQELYEFEMENLKAYIDYLIHLNMIERAVGTAVKPE